MSQPRTRAATVSAEMRRLAEIFFVSLDHDAFEDPTAELAELLQKVHDAASTSWLVSATDEDLQVAEDALRELGRHDEANRVMGFRLVEPAIREAQASLDAQNRFTSEHGWKPRKKALRAEFNAIGKRLYDANRALEQLSWETFGTFVPWYMQTRARELGKDFGSRTASEVSDAAE